MASGPCHEHGTTKQLSNTSSANIARSISLILMQETLAARKAARRAERDALARGEMPDSLKDWRVSSLFVVRAGASV